MFGMSFAEMVVLLLLAIIVVGPRQLPTMMRTAGRMIAKGRRMLFDMRTQSGIDDILRNEGIERDIREFRSLVRGNVFEADVLDSFDLDRKAGTTSGQLARSGSLPQIVSDETLLDKEYPKGGVDTYGAVGEDLSPYVPDEPQQPSESQPPA